MKKRCFFLNISIIFCAFLNSELTFAQLGFCNGDSGAPIFTETFGTGTNNIPLPAGTTSYTYINGDPQDGQYTVSSSTAIFDWHNVPDHTPGDISGRCLIVNADFTSGEFYRTNISGLCENTSYEFSSWLINLLPPSGCGGSGIPINVKFEIWDGTNTSLLASGDTGNISGTSNPTWAQYALVFQTLPAQTSVILKMINNGTGGCGNDLAIDDIVFKSCGDSISVIDASNNNGVTICSNQTPYDTIITAIPDNSVFSNHFYQWQESTDNNIWTNIIGATNQNLTLTGITSTMYFRTLVAEFQSNLLNADCVTFSDVFQISINQAPNPPILECWETTTFNNTTCAWEINGSQPIEPTGLDCWETTAFNPITCVWDVSGTQPNEPTGLDCWEITAFNTNTCAWEVNGTQPVEPTGLNCWETTIFNPITCVWDVSGTQPNEPTGLDCWEITAFNTITCAWEVNGTQPVEPTGLNCWETTTFNTTNCAWDISGAQPIQPTGLDCWEITIFNPITCVWDVSGTQPIEPTGLNCWETTTFNSATCVWDVSGMQPPEPNNIECWEIAIFNDSTCLWEITGSQPLQPTDLECWETTNFNTSSCLWDVTGDQPLDLIDENITLCENENITLTANNNFVNPTYLWDTGDTTPSININTPGIYSVEVLGDNCITLIQTFYVDQIESPIIASVESDGNVIIITTTNSGDFEYSLDGDFYQPNNVISANGGLYTVFVRERSGCGITTINHLHFVIPNFFTPNNDGYNDTFDLKGIEFYETSEVYIFNRYGKLIKSTKNSHFSWNGTFNNKELPTSDYWYLIRIDNYEFKGSFTLKR